MPRPRLLAALAVAGAVALVPAAAGAAERQLYVALGDSYATGFQRLSESSGRMTRTAYPNQVVRLARTRGWNLTLVNVGCGGATTTTVLRQRRPCPRGLRAVGGRTWGGRTQLGAAERLLRRNRGRVALVTVSIGGNDVTRCARGVPDPIGCVTTAVRAVERDVRTIARRLRRAAGPRVRIVGTTYPDVILGQWVGDGADEQLARLSVVAFQSLINPALKRAYEAAGGRLVDVTAATGAYTPLDQTTTLEPYGTIPVAVARVCELTSYCRFRDIHMTTAGYRIIAELVARTLPRRR
jgi:lysophospholipase L1-like esterase